MPPILVSIIVPCYNQGQYLPEALNSVLGQSYTNWECIIVNDGSTDGTEEISTEYCRKNKQFKYITKPNGGVSSSRNEGMKHIRGDYVKFLDADDWLAPTSLEKSILCNNNNDLIISKVKSFIEEEKEFVDYYFDLSTIEITYQKILLNWAVNFDIPIHSALISTKLLTNFHFNEELDIGEDWLMWLHIFKQKPAIFIINEPLVFYRKWHNSATTHLNKTLINEFWAYQYVIAHFNLDQTESDILNNRILKKLTDKIEFLEQSNNYIKNSTSFKLGYFFVSRFKFLHNLLTIKKK